MWPTTMEKKATIQGPRRQVGQPHAIIHDDGVLPSVDHTIMTPHVVQLNESVVWLLRQQAASRVHHNASEIRRQDHLG